MQQIPCQPAGDRFLPDLVYITFGLHKKRKKRIDNLFDLWYKVRKVIRFLQEADRMESMQDKFMTTVRIGPKGQIVIPKEVRAMFGLEPGDSLILLADRERGIALQSSSYYDSFVRAVFDQGAKAAVPGVPEAETQVFASALEQELKRGDGE
jgi:AbrB family looped-hinge helix DNA binding protein